MDTHRGKALSNKTPKLTNMEYGHEYGHLSPRYKKSTLFKRFSN